MNTAKKALHTPGPWKFYQNENNLDDVTTFYVLGPGSCHIASIDDCDDSDNLDNARLIAVAPELLEVAKDALAALDDVDETEGMVEDPAHSEDWNTCVRLRSAIAKAEGR